MISRSANEAHPPSTIMNYSGANHANTTESYQHQVALTYPPPPHPDTVTSQCHQQLSFAGHRERDTTLIVPTYRDVLYGRGQGKQRHPGNVIFRALVFANKVRHETQSLHTLSSVSICTVPLNSKMELHTHNSFRHHRQIYSCYQHADHLRQLSQVG